MMVRLLAFMLFANTTPGIQARHFIGGDGADLWLKDLTGAIDQRISVGQARQALAAQRLAARAVTGAFLR